MATEKLVNLGSHLTSGFNIQHSASPGNGCGGTCGGDSGKPLLYRVGTVADQNWIRSTIGEAQWSLVRIVGL